MINKTDFIWDFDGMLYNSYDHILSALSKCLNTYDIPYDPAEAYSKLKISLRHACDFYGLSPEQRQLFHSFEHDMSLEPVPYPYPGIPGLLEKIYSSGKNNYLVTNRNRQSEEYLLRDGLYKYFAGFINTEDGYAPKPSSEGVTALINKYTLGCGNCLMIGDREVDITAGLGAGIEGCIFDEFGTVTETSAIYRVHSIEELTGFLL